MKKHEKKKFEITNMRLINFIIALVLNFFPGLGMLYLRRIDHAIILFFVGTIYILSITWLISSFMSIYTTIILPITYMLSLVFYTWNITKTPRKNVKKIGYKKSVSLGILIIILYVSASLNSPVHNFHPYNIPSASMSPSLLIGDYVMAVEMLEDENINAGDMVVFRLPSDMSIDYIQRVVGLPGDRVQVIEGILHINGDKLSRQNVGEIEVSIGAGNMRAILYEETFSNGHKHVIQELRDDLSFDNTPEFEVPEGHLFMMGDNRDNSRDSRSQAVGFVPMENLVGKAEFIYFSHNNSARLFEIWKWPFAIRYSRIGKSLH